MDPISNYLKYLIQMRASRIEKEIYTFDAKTVTIFSSKWNELAKSLLIERNCMALYRYGSELKSRALKIQVRHIDVSLIEMKTVTLYSEIITARSIKKKGICTTMQPIRWNFPYFFLWQLLLFAVFFSDGSIPMRTAPHHWCDTKLYKSLVRYLKQMNKWMLNEWPHCT